MKVGASADPRPLRHNSDKNNNDNNSNNRISNDNSNAKFNHMFKFANVDNHNNNNTCYYYYTDLRATDLQIWSVLGALVLRLRVGNWLCVFVICSVTWLLCSALCALCLALCFVFCSFALCFGFGSAIAGKRGKGLQLRLAAGGRRQAARSEFPDGQR